MIGHCPSFLYSVPAKKHIKNPNYTKWTYNWPEDYGLINIYQGYLVVFE